MSHSHSVFARRIQPNSSRRACNLALAVSLAIGLSGCLGSLLPEQEASRQFTLPGAQQPAVPLQSPWQKLLVDELNAAPSLDGDRLLVIGADGEVQRLGDGRWIAEPAVLVRAGLTDRLSAMQAATSVSRQALRFAVNLRLSGELQAFQYDPDLGAAKIQLSLHLICPESSSSLGNRQFVAAVPSASESAAVVTAFAQGLDQISVQVGQWIANQPLASCEPLRPVTSDSVSPSA